MNKHVDDILPFDDMRHEIEWLIQENAMRREPLRLDSARNDMRDRHYHLLTRALREPLQDGLPADFATRVAARTNAALASSARFELTLMIVLIVTMVIAASVVVVTYGSEWMSSFSTLLFVLRAPANSWLMAFASCLGVSWLVEQWRLRYSHQSIASLSSIRT